MGVYKSALYEEADRASNLLAYYYEIDGVHFIGLNTPYNGDDSISGNVYTLESIEWVAQTLESIDREETIIFLSHYMLQDSRGMTPGYGISNLNGANDRLKEMIIAEKAHISAKRYLSGLHPMKRTETYNRQTVCVGAVLHLPLWELCSTGIISTVLLCLQNSRK